jgi:hypothetical protein
MYTSKGGVFWDLITSIERLLDEKVKGHQSKKKQDCSIRESSDAVQLDARFASISAYPWLKRSGKFSLVTQWTGNEQRDLVKILIPAITPLLLCPYQPALTAASSILPELR